MLFSVCIFLLCVVLIKFGHADIFQVLEDEMMSARAKQAVMELSDILTEKVEDRPKEIEITCPGNVSPSVIIRDLVPETASGGLGFDGGECMVLKMKGHNFDFALSINCDEFDNDNVDMKFKTGRDHVNDDTFNTVDEDL